MDDAVPRSISAPPAKTVLTTAGIRRGGRWQQVFTPVKNVPGELLRIDKSQLRIDPAYQRKLDMARVASMAANWSWVSCGCLIVSRRSEDAVYFIIDGQHRWEAAKFVPDIRDLPCLAFPLDQLRDEAVGFLAANTVRKLPSLADQFKALLIAQDRDALLAHRLAGEARRHISAPSSPYTISCASEFLRLIQQDREAVEACWPAITELCRDQTMPARILRGVIGLQRRMAKGHSFAEERWSQRLQNVGWNAVTDEIKRLGAIEGNYSERACAEGVLRALNKGLRLPMEINWNAPRAR